MTLGVVGSRSISLSSCEWYILEYILKYNPDVICSGGAKGVDSHAASIADALSIPTLIFLPNWKLGLHAGFLRNQLIVDNSDVILAIFPGSVRSGGTKDTVLKAKASGVPVFEVFLSDSQIEIDF